MQLKKSGSKITIQGKAGDILIRRNKHGIIEIEAKSIRDAMFGQGWAHANDRQLQIFLTRSLVKGEASKDLAADDELIEIDKYMRRMNFTKNIGKGFQALEKDIQIYLTAYAEGINSYMSKYGTVFELKLLKFKPKPWSPLDTLIIGKIFGFLGLADAQGNMEKFILQIIQNGVEIEKIKELFPYIKEEIDYELLKKVKIEFPMIPDTVKWLHTIPKMVGSNNWVVSGEHTKFGKPILCNDPHLEVNRLPSIWAEMVIKTPELTIKGVTLPGAPGVVLGRNNYISWGATFSFMDMLDFHIEHCKDGKYRRGANKWIPFEKREEIITTKDGRKITEVFFENENGILEGNPYEEGYYLTMDWSAQNEGGEGEFNGLANVMLSKTVKEAQEHYKKLKAATFNFVIADREGNIGYQMTGQMFDRPKGVSGLLPVPSWLKKYNYNGYINPDKLPSLFNPENGMIVTANQDLNHWCDLEPINLPMATYRADRITDLLEQKAKNKLSLDDMKKIHYDLYSIQAEKFMKIIKPLLPNTVKASILKNWDFYYQEDSRGAFLFEEIYTALMKTVFGDNGLGRDTVDYMFKETNILYDYYGNFDNILLKDDSAWFNGSRREEIFKKAIDEGLKASMVKKYGDTRKIYFSHLLFGGKLPSIIGFDYGPVSLPGNRATVTQGQIFRSAGRVTTFSPSWRMISDMSNEDMLTNLPGGTTDRRFSKWYTNDMKNWFKGIYKKL